MISIHWEVIVGSIYSYSFILLVSQHWDVIIVSLYAHYKFLLFYLSHPRFDLSLFVSFFRFSSLGHHLMFYLCSFLVPLVSHHWDAILDSSFYIKLIYLFLFFFITRTSSQVLSMLNFRSFGFQSLECHPMFYLGLVDCFFRFSSL